MPFSENIPTYCTNVLIVITVYSCYVKLRLLQVIDRVVQPLLKGFFSLVMLTLLQFNGNLLL